MQVPATRDPDVYRNMFTCAITTELYDEPVTEEEGTCGHTYERYAIEEHLVRMGNNFCPVTRLPLTFDQLKENDVLQEACDLLRPERKSPLTDSDWRVIHNAAEAFEERRIAKGDIDESILSGIRESLEKAAKAVTEYVGRCS